MPRVFFGNLDFEHELAEPAGWRAPEAVRRMIAERVASWVAIAEEGDRIWTPEPINDSFWQELREQGLPRVQSCVDLNSALRDGFELTPWGLSRTVADRVGGVPLSQLQAARIGNSRSWSFELEQQLDVAPPGAARLERLEDFPTAILHAANQLEESVDELRWVIKANFGMAARERLLGQGPILTDSQQHWLRRRLKVDLAVFLEPWLRLNSEVGIQWNVPAMNFGKPQLVGLAQLLTDAQGHYQGSRITLESGIPIEWQSAVEVSQVAAERLQSIGYVGPLGIDAAIATDACGRVIVRPLQDINARFTMGRLALGFRRFLHSGESAEWQHGTADNARNESASDVMRTIVTSPPSVGGSPTRHHSCLRIVCRPDDPFATDQERSGATNSEP